MTMVQVIPTRTGLHPERGLFDLYLAPAEATSVPPIPTPARMPGMPEAVFEQGIESVRRELEARQAASRGAELSRCR